MGKSMGEGEAKRVRLDERLALRPKEAAQAIGLSERAFRTLLPRLPHVRAGGAVLVPVAELRRWLVEEARAQTHRTDRVVDEVLAKLSED